jgi:hypothetical protein
VNKKMFKTRKSQAAMEFLMTYGWAILVVLVAIGALAYFGVLSPDRFLPSKCQLPSGIACTDFKITSGAAGTVEVVLRNGLGFDIDPIAVAIDGDGCVAAAATAVGGDDCAAAATALPNGDMCSYQATCGAISAGKFSADLSVTYTNTDSNIQHTIEGTIVAQAE